MSRGAILEYWQETGREDVSLFLTISTPWGGDVAAARADEAPIDLPPSFADMSPSSDYLRELFYADAKLETSRRLPARADFHMMFGFRMKRSSHTANDGRVSVASQARLEAQQQAATIRAFDHGHVDILHSREAVDRLNLLLADRFPD